MKFLPATFLLLSAVAKAADTNALPALAPAYGEMPPTFWEQHGTLVIIGVFAFVILAMLVLWKLFQPKPAVILPPEVLAREALAKLIGRHEDGKLLSDVSQILRRYVIAAFELPTGELTTAEFCAALAGNEKIGAELVGSISSFLRECDERKFSPSPRAVGVQASACLDKPPAMPGTLKRELQPAAARAFKLVALVQSARAGSHGQDARATNK